MDTPTSTPSPFLTAETEARYLEHFSMKEYKFRWIEATGLDTQLPTRANHLAARFIDLYIQNASASASIERLMELTRGSRSTVQRATKDLVAGGWLAPRLPYASNVVLLMPDRGIDLLIARQKSQAEFRGRAAVNDHHAALVLAHLNNLYGTNLGNGRGPNAAPHLCARIRSIIAHMVEPDIEVRKLVDTLTESPPADLQDPVGFLLARACEHLRARPHLGRRGPDPVRDQRTRTDAVDISGLLEALGDAMGSGWDTSARKETGGRLATEVNRVLGAE